VGDAVSISADCVVLMMAMIERARTDDDRLARHWIAESMDRINVAIQGADDLEKMMSDVLDATRSIFESDRAWLVYPCDPEARAHGVKMQRTRPEFPGAFDVGVDVPMDADSAAVLRIVRAASGPVTFGPGCDHPIPAGMAKQLAVQSRLLMGVYPKGDRPYMFGLSQCSHPRVWTALEKQLFQAIGRRLTDGLTSLSMLRRLRESERRLEDAQRLAHVGHWERDVESDLAVWSDETYRIFGLRPQERSVSVTDLYELIHPDDRPLFVAATTALRAGQPYDLEYRVVRPSGDVRFVHAQGHLRKDDSRRAPRMFGTVQDITERKRAEYLAAQVFESSPDRVAIIGRDYRLRRVNPMFERFWELPAARALTMSVADVVGQEMFEETFKPQLDRCFAGEEVSFAAWIRYGFGRRYVAITYTPLRPGAERVEASLMISRDLTDHMVAVDALQQAQAALAHVTRVTTLGELAASIAHEINQPLAAIAADANACLNWLATAPPKLELVREALGAVVNDSLRAGEVIHRIRQLATKSDPQRTALQINDVICEVVPLVRREVSEHDVSLRLDLASGIPEVLGDRVQLQQVLINLVVNGIEAMLDVADRRRELVIRSRAPDPRAVLVAVHDAGGGIDPENIGQLFTAFFSTKRGGMGMGLSISRSIIEAHGGRLSATPGEPHGAVFTFSLPVDRPPATSPTPDNAAIDPI
jgi:PAS domain S-box-containing protein